VISNDRSISMISDNWLCTMIADDRLLPMIPDDHWKAMITDYADTLGVAVPCRNLTGHKGETG